MRIDDIPFFYLCNIFKKLHDGDVTVESSEFQWVQKFEVVVKSKLKLDVEQTNNKIRDFGYSTTLSLKSAKDNTWTFSRI